jgi:hypothetical protein
MSSGQFQHPLRGYGLYCSKAAMGLILGNADLRIGLNHS